jgi:GT2 family glycosyltransferase
MPQLSIIIPSYRRVDLLAACLRSINTYRTPGDELQIIVVDDASADYSVSTVANSFPGVTVIRQPRQQGFCAAVNAGLRVATAPTVQVLNDDAEVLDGWYAPALERFAQNSRLGSLAPLVLNWNNRNLIDSAGDGYDPGGYAYSHGKGEVVSGRWLTARVVFSTPASAGFYRRAALTKAGGFPEEFVAYFDDLEVGRRLQAAGYCCLYEPACRVLHHGSASLHATPRRRLTQQLACNEERLYWRSGEAWRHLPRHLAVLGAKAVRRWSDGTLMPFLTGRVQAWWELLPSVSRMSTSHHAGG